MTASKRKKALRKLLQSQKDAGLVGHVMTPEEQKVMTVHNVDVCGYLRKPIYLDGDYYGNCALQDFDPCDYPCNLPNLAHGKYEDFKCPTYKHFMKH